MISPELDDFSFELRKINAIKINRRMEKSKTGDVSEENDTHPAEISVSIKQQQDKKKIDLYVYYKTPLIAEAEVEVDADFMGVAYLKEPFDIEEDKKLSLIMDIFINESIMPRVAKGLDKTLLQIFKNMGVKYKSHTEKAGGDSTGTKTDTKKG